ncbi:MAG: hypothetical protein DHS20C13_02830 [Thermodesulfobacteriota bacterium]|nr:MAG: hypothetical protein DHS20C13_02830 [Thermodesulfobacteriota bacterium]
MSVVDDSKVQNGMSKNEVIAKDESTHICTYCGYKGEHKKQNMVWSILLIAIGIIGIPLSISMNIAWVIGSILVAAVGVCGVSTNYIKHVKCPDCGNNTYIPIDSEKAQEMLKEYNISIANKTPK